MRYIYYIGFIILLTTLGLWGTSRVLAPDSSEDTALSVNGRVISDTELESRKKYSPYSFRSRDEFLNDLITRELLIQEARRRKIDREEPFRMSMENHYEQALIKQVMDRRLAELEVEITLEDIAAYRAASRLRYQLEQLNYASPDGATAGPLQSRQVVNEDFINLPTLWQLQLLDLKSGSSCSPFPLDSGYCVLKVIDITSRPSSGEGYADDEIRQLLTAAHRQLAMDRWLDGLRRKADIELSAALRQKEGQG